MWIFVFLFTFASANNNNIHKDEFLNLWKDVSSLHTFAKKWDQNSFKDPKKLKFLIRHLNSSPTLDFKSMQTTVHKHSIVLRHKDYSTIKLRWLSQGKIQINEKATSLKNRKKFIKDLYKMLMSKGKLSNFLNTLSNKAYAQVGNVSPYEVAEAWASILYGLLTYHSKDNRQARIEKQRHLECLPLILPYYQNKITNYCQSINGETVSRLQQNYREQVSPMAPSQNCLATQELLHRFFTSTVTINSFSMNHRSRNRNASITTQQCVQWTRYTFSYLPALSPRELNQEIEDNKASGIN